MTRCRPFSTTCRAFSTSGSSGTLLFYTSSVQGARTRAPENPCARHVSFTGCILRGARAGCIRQAERAASNRQPAVQAASSRPTEAQAERAASSHPKAVPAVSRVLPRQVPLPRGLARPALLQPVLPRAGPGARGNSRSAQPARHCSAPDSGWCWARCCRHHRRRERRPIRRRRCPVRARLPRSGRESGGLSKVRSSVPPRDVPAPTGAEPTHPRIDRKPEADLKSAWSSETLQPRPP
jgi:hypothetical protein